MKNVRSYVEDSLQTDDHHCPHRQKKQALELIRFLSKSMNIQLFSFPRRKAKPFLSHSSPAGCEVH